MAELSNKSDKEELLNQIKAYLSSAEVCASVFTRNPSYLPYCKAQQNRSAAQVTELVKNQVESISSTAKVFLTTSYSAERTNQTRRKL